MATDRPRIQAYVEPAIHDFFLKWKQELGIARDSEALNQLLAEYFGVSSQSPIPNPQFSMEEIHERIALEVAAQLAREENHSKFEEINTDLTNFGMHLESIEARFIQLSDRLEAVENIVRPIEGLAEISHAFPESPSDSLARSPEQLPKDETPGLEDDDIGDIVSEDAEPIEVQATQLTLPGKEEYSEALGDSLSNSPDMMPTQEAPGLEGSADGKGDTADELVSESPSDSLGELTASGLAKRLGVSKSWISRHKQDISFEEDTREKDPEAIAWRYDRKKQKFFPANHAN